VTVSRTDGKDGVIALVAGNGTGTGNLDVDAKLSADTIDLSAGLGDGTAGTSRVILGNGALFAGGSPSNPNPKHFSMTQDATMAAADQPSRANFADPGDPNDPNAPNPLAGMELALRSLGGSLTVADTDLIHGTHLTLEGKTGVALQLKGDGLALASLDEKGAMTLDGSLDSAGDLSIDGALTLDKVIDPDHTAGDQQPVANGALTVTGKTTKTTAGSIGFGPDAGLGTLGAISIGDVATNHTGGAILVHGTTVKTGVLDASGT